VTTWVGRAAVAAALLAAALPSATDFHVLGTAHRDAHEVTAAGPVEARVAEACAHAPARHVEAGTTTAAAPQCALCARRSPSQPHTVLALRIGSLLPFAAPRALAPLPVRSLVATHPTPRGPPRA
jgi:hypothetical protein